MSKASSATAVLDSTDLRKALSKRKLDSRIISPPVLIYLMGKVMRHPFLVLVTFLAIGILIGLDLFSIALFLPFLDALQGGNGGLVDATPLAFLVALFEDYTIVERIRFVAGLLVATQVAKAVVLYLADRTLQYMLLRVQRDIRFDIFRTMMDTEMRYIGRYRQGNLFTILHSFPSSGTKIVNEYIKAMHNSTMVIAAVIAMASFDVTMTAVALTLAVLVTWMISRLNVVLRRQSIDMREQRMELHRFSLEAIQGLKTFHLFGRTKTTKQRFEDQLIDFQRIQYRNAWLSGLVAPLFGILSMGFFAGLIILATFLLDRSDDAWVAILTAFVIVNSQLMGKTGKFAKRRANLAKEMPAMETLLAFMRDPRRSELPDGKQTFARMQRGIKLDNVSFRYGDKEPWVLNGITMDIPKGKMTAVVGGSGAGKSTLVDLVARLYDPTQGKVLVDGKPLPDFEVDSWRARIAVVSQDTFLFNDTVLENIRFGRPDASDAEVQEAARIADAEAFIRELPQDMMTMVGDRGTRLSGGQRQRIAIARAVLADPDLLILDEATSALDTASERLVQQALTRLGKGRTVLAVAHRLSTIREADNIVILEKGEIVEQGDHATLAKAGGQYGRYLQLQDGGLNDEAQAQLLREVRDDATIGLGNRDLVDEDIFWFDLVLDRDPKKFIPQIMALPGVFRAEARLTEMELIVQDLKTTLPKILGLLRSGGIGMKFIEPRAGDTEMFLEAMVDQTPSR